MRERKAVAQCVYFIFNLTMVAIYAAGGIVLFFWDFPALPPQTRKILSGVLLAYAAFRGYVLFKNSTGEEIEK